MITKFIKAIIICSCLTASAVCPAGASTTPLRLSLTRDIALFKHSDVVGLDLGLISFSTHNITGIQVTPLFADAGNLNGIQFSAVGWVRENINGIQLGIFGAGSGKNNGISLGGLAAVNGNCFNGIRVAGLFSASNPLSIIEGSEGSSVASNGIEAAGLFSFSPFINGVQVSGISNGAFVCNGLQLSGIHNFTFDKTSGLQLSLISNVATAVSGGQVGMLNYSEKLFNSAKLSKAGVSGFQIGLVNYSNRVCGMQLGVCNICSDTLKGVQIGVFNYAKNSKLLPVMIGINAGWGEENNTEK